MVPSRGSGRFSLERDKPRLFDRLREALRVRRAAAKTGLTERATCRAFRHSFATHPLESGRDIRAVRDRRGARTRKSRRSISMRSISAVRSPADGLRGGLGGSAQDARISGVTIATVWNQARNGFDRRLSEGGLYGRYRRFQGFRRVRIIPVGCRRFDDTRSSQETSGRPRI